MHKILNVLVPGDEMEQLHGLSMEWRLFAILPWSRHWSAVRDFAMSLEGYSVEEAVEDPAVGFRMLFTLVDQELAVGENGQHFRFFVSDPGCPDEILNRVIQDFGPFLS